MGGGRKKGVAVSFIDSCAIQTIWERLELTFFSEM